MRPQGDAPYSKRKRAFRRALGKFYRRAASCCRFLVRRFVVLSFRRFVVWLIGCTTIRPKICEDPPKSIRNESNINPNSSKMGPKSVQNWFKIHPKCIKMKFWMILGVVGRRVGPRMRGVTRGTRFLAPFWLKMGAQGAILGAILEPKSVQNRCKNRYQNRCRKSVEK